MYGVYRVRVARGTEHLEFQFQESGSSGLQSCCTVSDRASHGPFQIEPQILYMYVYAIHTHTHIYIYIYIYIYTYLFIYLSLSLSLPSLLNFSAISQYSSTSRPRCGCSVVDHLRDLNGLGLGFRVQGLGFRVFGA